MSTASIVQGIENSLCSLRTEEKLLERMVEAMQPRPFEWRIRPYPSIYSEAKLLQTIEPFTKLDEPLPHDPLLSPKTRRRPKIQDEPEPNPIMDWINLLEIRGYAYGTYPDGTRRTHQEYTDIESESEEDTASSHGSSSDMVSSASMSRIYAEEMMESDELEFSAHCANLAHLQFLQTKARLEAKDKKKKSVLMTTNTQNMAR